MEVDVDFLKKILDITQVGWCILDRKARSFECSDYLCKVLGLKGTNILSFDKFFAMIPGSYAEVLKVGFSRYFTMYDKFYDTTYPIDTPEGEVWFNYKMISKMGSDSNYLVVVKRVDPPDAKVGIIDSLQVLSTLKQNSFISAFLHSLIYEKNLDKSVNKVLHTILDFYKGDRCYIFEFSDDDKYQSNTYEVVAEGVSEERQNLQHGSVDVYPWWSKKILKGEPIILDSIEQLPPEAKTEYDILAAQNIRSIIVTPLQASDRVWGYMGVDIVKESRKWSNRDYYWLSSLSNIVSLCMELRKKMPV